MSAFMCNDDHLSVISGTAFVICRDVLDDGTTRNSLFAELKLLNQISLEALYGVSFVGADVEGYTATREIRVEDVWLLGQSWIHQCGNAPGFDADPTAKVVQVLCDRIRTMLRFDDDLTLQLFCHQMDPPALWSTDGSLSEGAY